MHFADQLQERLYDFAQGIIRFCRGLPKSTEALEFAASFGVHLLARQPITGRLGGVVHLPSGALDLGVVVEELDEADHWVALIRDAEVGTPPQKLIVECRELRAILAKSRATSSRKAAEQKGS